jgi:hypothetical protein
MVAFTPAVLTGNALWMNHPSGISCGSVSWTMRTLKCCGLLIGKGYFPVRHALCRKSNAGHELSPAR